MVLENTPVLDSIYGIIDQFIIFFPILVTVIVLIILGWLLGRLLGNIGSKVLDKVGLDDLINKTMVGDMIKKAEMSTVGFFSAVIRWFVYIIFAVIIIDLLKIQIIADFVTQIIFYIPRIASALAVLIIGILIVDFITNLIKKVLMATGVDDRILSTEAGKTLKATGITISAIIAGLVKLFGYLIFIMAASEIVQLTMITRFLADVINYLPNLFTGIIILVIGFLAIDFFMDYIQATMKGMNVEGSEIVLPILKGFLFLIIILLSLDTMLINTSVFYLFLGPLAWGFAVVVAFKWGIKEALVAYAGAKK